MNITRRNLLGGLSIFSLTIGRRLLPPIQKAGAEEYATWMPTPTREIRIDEEMEAFARVDGAVVYFNSLLAALASLPAAPVDRRETIILIKPRDDGKPLQSGDLRNLDTTRLGSITVRGVSDFVKKEGAWVTFDHIPGFRMK